MDPVSAFGLFSGAIQVLQAIASTVGGLRQLAGKLREADLTIQSLIQELACIRTALTSLKEWLRIHRSGSGRDGPKSDELDHDLAVAMDGCRVIMEVLSYEVLELVQSAEESGGIGFKIRMKVVWNDEAMRGHQEKLHAQVQALQLLLQVCQCHSSTEQVRLLRRATTRQIIGKVAGDTATLRSGRLSRVGSDADNLSESSSRRAFSDRIFDFDATIMNSPVYQRALQQWTTSSLPPNAQPLETRPLETHPQPSRQPSISIIHSSFTDEGYGSYHSEAHKQKGLGLDTAQQQGDFLALPQSPSAPVHSRSQSQTQIPLRQNINGIRRIVSDSKALPRLQTSGSRLERFSSFLGRINTSSRRSLKGSSPVGSQNLPSIPNPRRGYRSRPNVHTSIDLAKDGASVSPLIKAAQAGSREEAERLIERGYLIDERHERSGRTALLVASHCGKEEVVDLLICSGARLTVTDGSGETALHLAASRGHWEVIELLMVERGLIETPNLKGRTALRVAADCGQPESVQVLLMHHAQVNARAENQMTALHAAAKRGDEEIMQLLLAQGADIEAKDGTMMTALHYACEEGHIEAIRVLLDYRANIEAPGRDHKTPLICAAGAGKAQAVDFLLKRKASLRSADDSEMTALHWAAYNGHEETVRILSEKKGALDTVNSVGRTALHLAVMQSQFAVVELLQRKGAPLETRCKTGLTALHYACMADSFEITRLLLLTGADVEASESQHQQRPLHIVAARGSIFLLDLLCAKGALLDARNGVGDRPLCVASRFGHVDVVQKLLDRGSPLSLKFDSGFREDSPLCLAAMGGHWHVASLLLGRGASVLKKDEAGWQPIRYAVYYGQPDLLQLLLSSGKMPDADIPDLLNMPDTVGFAPGIPEERKYQVQQLLSQSLRQPSTSTPASLPRASQGESLRDSFLGTYTPPPAIEADSSTPVELPGSLDQERSISQAGSVDTSPRMATPGARPPAVQPLPLASDRVTALLEAARGESPIRHQHRRRSRHTRSRSQSRPKEASLLSATVASVPSSSFVSPPLPVPTAQAHRPPVHRMKDEAPSTPVPDSHAISSYPTPESERVPRTLPTQTYTTAPAASQPRIGRQEDYDSDSDSISSVYTALEGDIEPDPAAGVEHRNDVELA
ncbi:uncharacterized protein N7482_005255 [Penicillium canariense]|uniref:Ankyrin repeat protein n=1 Tax=Penicillium canariense TaxID=189055 RepID=A0A9W9I4K4_9EURO|nr:uncharacterized protein N7482_005255 [Penicillium canariense]KAJ5166474.1 hypothetical protein N7482_005255 [Penicillium canariense]